MMAGLPDFVHARFDIGKAVVVFTSRRGGVSEGPFAAMNLSPYVGDVAEHVKENRRRLAAYLGAPDIVTVEQVHGNTYLDLDFIQLKEPSHLELQADALLTSRPGLPLAVLTADCLPLILVSSAGQVAAVHCGWRGLVDRIVPRVVKKMKGKIRAFIGPGISACCYEIGKEVYADIYAIHKEAVQERNGKLFADLKKFIYLELVKNDVAPDSIYVSEVCTYCRPDLFFSYRRAKKTGRQAGIVIIRE